MMKKLIFIPVLALLIASCSSLDVVVDQDRAADFTTYKTFNFLPWPEHNTEILSDLSKRRVQAAITNELELRGLKKVDADADLMVNFMIILEKKTGVQAYTNYYGAGYGGYGYYYPIGYGYSQTSYVEYDYLRGTGIIDVFDSSNKHLVWQGTGIGTVQENNSNMEKRIKKAIHTILARYPIRPIKK